MKDRKWEAGGRKEDRQQDRKTKDGGKNGSTKEGRMGRNKRRSETGKRSTHPTEEDARVIVVWAYAHDTS